jgi:endonuclease YncB( thermonuclease family)
MVDPLKAIMDDLDGAKAEDQAIAKAIMEHGTGLLDTWTSLTFRKEPDDLIGKIIWWAGMLSQLIISTVTFPAALAAFLMEESAQSLGMGAYLLFTAKDWETFIEYSGHYRTSLDTFTSITYGLATVNPTTGGACLVYLSSAKTSAAAMLAAATYQIKSDARKLGIKVTDDSSPGDLLQQIKIAEAEKSSVAILKAQTLGTLALKSVPTNADIYIDGKALDLQTPETFKNLVEGPHDVAVSKYNTKTKKTDAYATTIEIIAGRKKEVTLHIPAGVSDDLINPGAETETDASQLPAFIKTTVTCVKMIDGDTFETNTGEKIRILGLDARETGQPIADLSKEFMGGKLLDHKVDIKIQTHLPIDTYGRTLAIVTYRDENVAVSSIAAGLAKALIFNDATYDPTRYLEAEKIAKTRQIGIWNPATPGIVWRGG